MKESDTVFPQLQRTLQIECAPECFTTLPLTHCGVNT